MNSIKKFSANSSLTVMVALLIAFASFGLTASVATAADTGEFYLGGGDVFDFGSYDYTGYDFGNYDYTGHDFGNYDYTGYDYGNYDYGGYDYGNYDYGGYDYGNYDYGGYDYGNYDYGGYDYGNYDFADSDYDYDGDYDYVDEYMEEYYEYQEQYQKSFQNQGFESFVPGFKNPKTPFQPTTPVCVHCQPNTPHIPTPKPTPCTTCGGGSTTNTNITNTNTNINQNTWIDNSINDSFNTVISNSGNTNITTVAPVVAQPIIQYQQQHAAPYCVITLTSQGVYAAQATLVWSSSNATSAYISSIGAVAPNGTRMVTGFANQIYTLTVTGPGGTFTCQTHPYTPTYVPPVQTPTVSLTQIPYTGLDMGPIGNAMYWLAMISVAAAGGYLLTYHSGSMLALATSAVRSRSGQADSSNHIVVSETEAEELAPVVEEETAEEVTPSTAILNFLPTMVATMTKDTMSIAHGTDGSPRLVISRA